MDHFHAGGDKRKFPRTAFKRTVRYKLKVGDIYSDHIAQDLSQGGIKVQSSQFVPVNARLIVQFQLVDHDRIIEVEGRVAWVKYIPSLDAYQMGFEFAADAAFQRYRINSHIRFLMQQETP